MNIEDFKKAYRKVTKEEERKCFLVHLLSFIFLNILMFLLDLFFTKGQMWFYFPLIFWGIGLLNHYLFSVRWIESELLKREAMAERLAKMNLDEKRNA
jgi:tellurite resistance protein TehA-like permease